MRNTAIKLASTERDLLLLEVAGRIAHTRAVSARQRGPAYCVDACGFSIDLALAAVAGSCCSRNWPSFWASYHEDRGPFVVTVAAQYVLADFVSYCTRVAYAVLTDAARQGHCRI